MEKQRGKRYRISKNGGTTTKGVTYGNRNTRRKKRKQEKYVKQKDVHFL